MKTATVPAGGGSEWKVVTNLDNGATNNVVGTLTFDTAGALVGATNGAGTTTASTLTDSWPGAGGAAAMNFTLDFASTTQYGTSYGVNSLSQNGYAPGTLSGVNIDSTGVIFANYTNGQSLTLGQVALANFANPQGLSPLGNTSWGQSYSSGQPVIGSPQTGTRGSIQAGAVEDSNVDISSELVNLIIAQRNYQANAKTIETENTVTQTIINLR